MKVREVIKLLEADGWYIARWQGGSHRKYKHPTKPGTIPVAGKESEDMAKGTANKILKGAGLK